MSDEGDGPALRAGNGDLSAPADVLLALDNVVDDHIRYGLEFISYISKNSLYPVIGISDTIQIFKRFTNVRGRAW